MRPKNGSKIRFKRIALFDLEKGGEGKENALQAIFIVQKL